jgi:hypothetical protein
MTPSTSFHFGSLPRWFRHCEKSLPSKSSAGGEDEGQAGKRAAERGVSFHSRFEHAGIEQGRNRLTMENETAG